MSSPYGWLLFGLSVESVTECRVQLIDHILSSVHVRYDVGYVVWRTVMSVSVFANPQVGFVIWVVVLVIVKDILQKHIGVVVKSVGREREILSLGRELCKIESDV